ncbi:ubp9p [Saccharomyces arboricola H-6]|uniref:Ubiquitin carboxyl-terminal hydrolase n=1 Tax=Saccharomyces arboricola (strain H-6 / AS 2.3317 / CBS 10644) TaxID=1160507 RepID=J8Q5S1_SACAR|nr:ubp9p [Saccharomyces arboricola H-6]
MIKRWLSVNRKKSESESGTHGNGEISRKALSLKKPRALGDPSLGTPSSDRSSSSSSPFNLYHESKSKSKSTSKRASSSKTEGSGYQRQNHHHHHHHHHSTESNENELECVPPSRLEDRALDTESSILFTTVTDLMPYGDGSNKIFGYENFGNTCYCNSVLQCLYNISEFRCSVLQYPERIPVTDRIRKSDLKGSKIRVFTNESFETSANGGSSNSGSQNNDTEEVHNRYHFQLSDQDTSSSSTQENQNNTEKKRNSFMGFGKNKSMIKDCTKKDENDESERLQLVHTVVMASDPLTEKLHEGCKRILVGRFPPKQGEPFLKTTYTAHQANCHCNSNLPKSRDEPTRDGNDLADSETLNHAASDSNSDKENTFPTSEQRKKVALIKGPILNIDHLLYPTEEATLYNGLKDIFESITENKSLTGIVSPSEFVKILKKENVLFNTMMQQDAHEFLNFLLNDFSEFIEYHNPTVNFGPEKILNHSSKNFISGLFKGTLTNRIRCLTCDNITSRDEPFLDFPIEVQGDDETDIQRILKSYQQREMLNGVNKFYCNKCYGLQEAERVVGLKQLPYILSLHLKRFKYSEEQNLNIKLFNKIRYPLSLDVSSTFESSVSKKYELCGVVIHMGSGPQHGHYVCICKNEKYGWLLYDDETVESIKEETVLQFTGHPGDQTTAYVLFYKETSIHKVEKQAENTDTLSQNQRQTEDNIEQLIMYDDWLRNRELKAAAEIERKKTLKDIPEIKTLEAKVPVSTADKKKIKQKRKSRILSFIK